MKNNFTIDFNKAVICTKALKDYYALKEDDTEVIYPSTIEKNSYKYVIYIFYSCLLDYGMRSKIYHKNLVHTYKCYPDIFDPKYVVDTYKSNSGELKDIIVNNIHPRYPNVALEKWLNLSEYLNDNKDLYDKIKVVNSYKDLSEIIMNIKGFGQKTGGLLLRLIYESGIVNFTFSLENIPIDRHDIEISYLNGVVNKNYLNEVEITSLGSTWVKAANKNNLNPALIDRYLWSVGNTFCNSKKCIDCPLNKTCKGKDSK